jgi:hypothetical protein
MAKKIDLENIYTVVYSLITTIMRITTLIHRETQTVTICTLSVALLSSKMPKGTVSRDLGLFKWICIERALFKIGADIF